MINEEKKYGVICSAFPEQSIGRQRVTKEQAIEMRDYCTEREICGKGNTHWVAVYNFETNEWEKIDA